MKSKEKKILKPKGPKLGLSEEELNKIKTIAEYLFMDQYQDNASYPRFEESFGAFCLEKSIDLPKVYKTLCGRRRKYITFRRLISSFNQWKKNPNKFNADCTKFLDLVYNNLLKKPGESIGKITDKAISYNTNNSEHKKAISQFCVITDEDQDTIKGFQITYDEFFKNNLFLNKENDKFYISLELNLAADLPTNENAQESFPDVNYRDGITHLGGTIKDEKINFLVFKCRSGKTSFIGKPSGTPFLFGSFGNQLHTIKIAIKDGSLIYIEPGFIEVERHNPKVDKATEEITENFIQQDKPIYEETILENVTNEEEVEKNILQPIMKDDRFYDRLKHTDKITGRPFFQIYPNVNRFIRFDPMSGTINVHIDPIDVIAEAANFITNRHEILNQVKRALQPKNILSGVGNLLLGGSANNVSPGQVLQDPVSLTNFLGDMCRSVERSAQEEGKKGIVKGLINGAVSGLSGLFSGGRGPVQALPPEPSQMNYPSYPNDPNMQPQPQMYPPMNPQINYPPPINNNFDNNDFNVEFHGQNLGDENLDQDYSSAKLRAGRGKKNKSKKDNNNAKKDNDEKIKLKAGLPFSLGGGGGLGEVFNVVNNVASNFFGFGGFGSGGGI